ncbi:hypothetical protein CXF77_08280 [Planococcus sp. MB-3u-09]|nr:hypothetical protein CXF66_13165 [Planococcus sp. Urea-trap-24]PKG87123.1 hypothetical protein CXF91_14005 [Planococcus sp. Urea-3u-39]PKH40227.1 hypothetical protein CXF77_08280 [Planococcus sp. MB-3u-09]
MERKSATPGGSARQLRPCRSAATKRLNASPPESVRLQRNLPHSNIPINSRIPLTHKNKAMNGLLQLCNKALLL